jgi:glycogen debranching enzyme
MADDFKYIRESLLNGMNTLISKKGFMYAGFPRFMELFGRDSLISSMELSYLYPEMLKSTLIILSNKQGTSYNNDTGEEPGKILHELAEKVSFENNIDKEKWVKPGIAMYYSIDSTPLFAIACEFYLNKYNDNRFLNLIKIPLENAIKWLIKKSEKNGFLTYNKIETQGKLASQGWMDGAWETYNELPGDIALIEIQGYMFEALKKYNKIFPENPFYDRIKNILCFLKKNVDKYFWMINENYYSPAVSINNGEIEHIRSVTSNAGHLLFTGLLGKDKKESIVKRIFKNDMMTPYGIRTLSSHSNKFNPYHYQSGSIWPNDNWIILRGLKISGFNNEANTLRSYLLDAIMTLKNPYEYYSVDIYNSIIDISSLVNKPCSTQAWTVGAFISILDNNY